MLKTITMPHIMTDPTRILILEHKSTQSLMLEFSIKGRGDAVRFTLTDTQTTELVNTLTTWLHGKKREGK